MYLIPVEYATPAYDELVRIRIESLYKPFNAELTVEDFEQEYKDIHLGLYNESAQLYGGVVVITSEEEDEFHNRRKIALLRQVVVANGAQGQGFGAKLMELIEKHFKGAGFKEIRLYSHVDAMDFYSKFGYGKHGREFDEKNVRHHTMKKRLIKQKKQVESTNEQ